MVIFTKPVWLRHAAGTGNGPLGVQRGFGTGEQTNSLSTSSDRRRAGADNACVPIFSLDIQPCARDAPLDEVRLATCGQDGKIHLWRLGALWEDAKQQCARLLGKPGAPHESTTPQQNGACENTLESALIGVVTPAHQGAANVVRWHPGGNVLASGGDDGTVLLSSRVPAAAGAVTAVEPFARGTLLQAPLGAACKEHWSVCTILRAHDSDVLDVSFAPHGEALASCSVDNTVCVWRIELSTKHGDDDQWITANGSLLARLRGHHGMVKGVSWDPANQFIATQSDDRSVLLWRTDHWGEIERRLSEEFEAATTEANLRSWFMRLAWSPSGAELVATNGYRNKCHVAPLYRRIQDFADPIEFVGHRAPVVSIRWSPCVYARSPHPPFEEKNRLYFCVALGSKDHGLTIWRADHGKPFVSLVDLFDGDVLDLSWNTAGDILVACSTDGSVFFAQFDPEELGYVVPEAVAKEAITKEMTLFTGGVNPLRAHPSNQLGDASCGMLDPVALALQRSKLAQQAPAFAKSGAETSTPVVEHSMPGDSRPPSSGKAGAKEPSPAAGVQLRLENQREERLKDGKRRIIPVPIGGQHATATPSLGVAAKQHAAHLASAGVEREPLDSADAVQAKKRQRSLAMNGASTPEVLPKPPRNALRSDSGVRREQSLANNHTEMHGLATAAATPKATSTVAPVASSGTPRSTIPLSTGTDTRRRLWILEDASPNFCIESVGQPLNTSLVFGVRSGSPLWKQVVRGAVTALTSTPGSNAIILGTSDAALHVLSGRSGLRLAPPFMLDAPAIWMARHERVILILTEKASFQVHHVTDLTDWRPEQTSRPLAWGSASFLLASENLEPVRLLPERFEWDASRQVLLLFLRNGDVYMHQGAHATWIRLMEDTFLASPFSEATVSATGYDARKQQALPTLDCTDPCTEDRNFSFIDPERVGLREVADPEREASDTTAHLELLFVTAFRLQKEAEARFWLQRLVEWLVQIGDEARLVALCDQLGGFSTTVSSGECIDSQQRDGWKASNMALIRQIVLPLLASNPALETILNTYRELLIGVSQSQERLPAPALLEQVVSTTADAAEDKAGESSPLA
ncbi:probable WD repeat domain protein [Cyanidioschyzon merolae strain 10D]|uniref:Protein HIRA n=1 Tax=Cyanidioschyzon merolae (strain NIES-3377 / 10D) TaxID=280699 RepID=M1V670_CYAM1|nr:probable WD repeat domain protein [Cyanidioschyzon merolae strain 10D]BAM81905.1 probable WD repeat domain protein [Cyanidioschyzon merolae strain 10D]|eukprot:XP_005537941.1 probable WD repeat domain protein [Cyanidioschyzon merolae strain 10D]